MVLIGQHKPLPAPGQDEQGYTHNHGHDAGIRPLDLAGHKAAGKDIDALQDPDSSAQDE